MYGDYEQTKEKLFRADDEVLLSDFLKLMVDDGVSWPDHIEDDDDVFNKNPNESFLPDEPSFVNVKARREARGRTDGCPYGCWRIMGRDKLIKSKETGKLLGFKKILKFCIKTKGREYKRSWVMEEYRLFSECKQNNVICKIQLMFQAEISSLLDKHFSRLITPLPSDSLPARKFFPAYAIHYLSHETEKDRCYLEKIIDSGPNLWPEDVTNDVYGLDPLKLVDLHDDMFWNYGICFFSNRTEICDSTYGCESGWWSITERTMVAGKLGLTILGNKRKLEFREKQKRRHFLKGSYLEITFFMEEYSLSSEMGPDKVLCVISAQRQTSDPLTPGFQ